MPRRADRRPCVRRAGRHRGALGACSAADGARPPWRCRRADGVRPRRRAPERKRCRATEPAGLDRPGSGPTVAAVGRDEAIGGTGSRPIDRGWNRRGRFDRGYDRRGSGAVARLAMLKAEAGRHASTGRRRNGAPDAGRPGAGEGAGPGVPVLEAAGRRALCLIGEVAAAERITRGYLGWILQLTLLAPDIVEVIKLGSTEAGKFCVPRLHRNGLLFVRVAAAERSDAMISVDR